jgi:NACalpha-BTF3-like transcription factor
VSKEDVEVIVRELELSSKHADRVLRENGGNLQKALQALVQ